ncbi:MAG: ethylbenzene dehydrogenase-related protein [Desulfobacula sp.]
MKRRWLSFGMMFFVIGCMSLGMYRMVQAAQLTVTVAHIQSAPAGLDDPVWKKLQTVSIPMEGRDALSGRKETVAVTAAYTDTEIFLLFKWKDPTQSVTKQSWVFDGIKWEHLPGDEDRLAILFEITRISKFATRGCAITCHSPPELPKDQWVLATKNASEMGDLWHWKAARSDPYQVADDSWLTIPGLLGEYDPKKQSGRRSDAGSGGDIKNEAADKSKPRYMPGPTHNRRDYGILRAEDAVEIADYTLFKPGDVLTYRMPGKPTGSRADIRAVSRYQEEGWTVMLSRKLNTGHDDDVVFDPKKQYSFAIGLFDDAGDDHSKATEPLILKFLKTERND